MNNEGNPGQIMTWRPGRLNPQDCQIALSEVRKDQVHHPRLYKIDMVDAIEQMRQIVYMAFMYTGKATDENNINFIANGLYCELLDNEWGSRNITMYEIDRAIRKAVLGQGKEKIYTISIASLYACLMDYIKGEGRQVEEMIRRKMAIRKMLK